MTQKKKAAAAAEETLALASLADPANGELVLAHVDPRGRTARHAPARHLTGGDLARLVYRESLAAIEPGDPRPDPRSPDPGLAAAIVGALLESGRFTTDLSSIEEPDPEPGSASPVDGGSDDSAPADGQPAAPTPEPATPAPEG